MIEANILIIGIGNISYDRNISCVSLQKCFLPPAVAIGDLMRSCRGYRGLDAVFEGPQGGGRFGVLAFLSFSALSLGILYTEKRVLQNPRLLAGRVEVCV